MDNAGYVIAGYSLTGLALLGYVVSLRARMRGARRRISVLSGDDGSAGR